MSKKKTTTPATAELPMHGDCCGGHHHTGMVNKDCCGSGDCCNGASGMWPVGLKLWWAVAWRTFVWITLPLLLVQFAMAYVQNPAILHQLYFTVLVMLGGATGAVGEMLVEPAFWFFVAVTVFSFLGKLYVYGRLAETGKLQRIADGN